jgi:ribonuclease HI
MNASAMKSVLVYTDGSCLGNPGPGGWAALLRYGRNERILSGGFARTTNNRMEVIAAIMALEALRESCSVDLYTDSRYLRDAVEKGWLAAWKKNGWQTAGKKPVKNRDLWERLGPLLVRHGVRLHWLAGHAGHAENETMDDLARREAAKTGLPPDPGAA